MVYSQKFQKKFVATKMSALTMQPPGIVFPKFTAIPRRRRPRHSTRDNLSQRCDEDDWKQKT